MSGNVDGEAGKERRHARDVPIVLARLVRAAEDHIIQASGIEGDAIDRAAHSDGGEIVGANVSESAARTPDWRANGGNDEGIAHSRGY